MIPLSAVATLEGLFERDDPIWIEEINKRLE